MAPRGRACGGPPGSARPGAAKSLRVSFPLAALWLFWSWYPIFEGSCVFVQMGVSCLDIFYVGYFLSGVARKSIHQNGPNQKNTIIPRNSTEVVLKGKTKRRIIILGVPFCFQLRFKTTNKEMPSNKTHSRFGQKPGDLSRLPLLVRLGMLPKGFV